jgi:hypothetical protein
LAAQDFLHLCSGFDKSLGRQRHGISIIKNDKIPGRKRREVIRPILKL